MILRRAAAALCAVALTTSPALAGAPAKAPSVAETQAPKVAWAPAVQPKPLSAATKRGLQWLLAQQLQNGGWGQGEESVNMGRDMKMAAQANVADTAMATLALLRSGSTPKAGAYAKNIDRAIGFVVSEIEASDAESLYVTSVRGTRVQGKIGQYVDTFLAAQLLAEVNGQMADPAANARVQRALDKVLSKIDRHQGADGTFANQGWAPALSQAIATKGVNRAAQSGVKVSRGLRERNERWAAGKFDGAAQSFRMGGDSAGVGLYSAAASVGALADAVNTNDGEAKVLRARLVAAPDDGDAKARLDQITALEATQKDAQGVLIHRLKDPRFAAGFGSNGGEEFLSYMLVSESLVVEGGAAWETWDKTIGDNLQRVQNKDGSWTGHHCITGRTFCTAAALLVLMADRAPVPLAKELQKG